MAVSAAHSVAEVDRPVQGTSVHAAQGLRDALALVQNDLSAVNRHILEKMQSDVALIPQLAGHIIAGGGKRIRPMLTLLSAGLLNYEGERHIGLAACVEFIHTATLLHDDVVDESDLRRGLDTANAVWGNKAPVLVGDFLFSRAFQLMVADGELRVLKILSDASARIAEGEVAQLLTANDLSTDRAAHLDVIRAKTATLFAAACEVGAVVAGGTEAQCEAARAYGDRLGIAFQLIDDAMDYQSSAEDMGKSLGDDFREGKITLPIILAYERGSELERAFWRRTLEECRSDESDLRKACQLLMDHDALKDSILEARGYVDEACEALASFPDSTHKSAMTGLARFVVDRTY